MDFPTILVILTLVTGVLWGLDALLWAPGRRRRVEELTARGNADPAAIDRAFKEPLLIEYARAFFPIILIVLVVRSFLAEPFKIPSGSMMPTLLVGDFILVNKFAYGLRLPVVNKKVVSIGEPKHGDIVVFRYPENPKQDFIKRVIGVPGDVVSYRFREKMLYVNGQPVAQMADGEYHGEGDAGKAMAGAQVRKENQGDKTHDILVMPNRLDNYCIFVPAGSPSCDLTVPANNYFVMGDNRDNSRDSRFWGFVPDENLVGKAFMIWMNWDSSAGGVAWRRLFTILN